MKGLPWVQSLLNIRQILEESKNSPLRHGKPFVTVGDISTQFYCEAKVELMYKLGRVETEPMREGIETHEKLLKMKKVNLQQIVQEINKGLPCLIRILLVSKVEDLLVAGFPDEIGFLAGKPRFLAELKTFGVGSFRLYSSHAVQAKMYALLLDKMGFDCSKLVLSVVGLRRGTDIDRKVLNRTLFSLVLLPSFHHLSGTVYVSKSKLDMINEKVLRLFRLNKPEVEKVKGLVEAGDLSVFCLPYQREEALKDLRWAKGYWLGLREPKPTQNLAKCRGCVYREECKYRPRLDSFLS
jgi:CRISPR/Cas system-associated exonuclease Cas4 (RecB family)